VRPSSRHPDRPILITEAPINVDDEYNRRRKRYLIMMIIRALCIIGAATTFTYSGWLAAAFVAAALVLPWSAVLIANDRPPKQALRFRRFLPGHHVGNELTAAPDSSGTGDRHDRQPGPAGRHDRQPDADGRHDRQSGADGRHDWQRDADGRFDPAQPGERPAETASPRIIDL
jgi:Protein of unknown function (DUF3099)